jgi:thiamine biosynthesis protein ThiS
LFLISLNGEDRKVAEGASLAALVDSLGLTAGRIACEVNGEIIRRADYGRTVLGRGDVVEVVQMMGGG